jgi:hypothetical protein
MDKFLTDTAKITPLLENVTRKIEAVREATKLYGPRLAPEFSGFRLLDPNEVRLSAVLVNLLNPEGNHAQGELFLRAFLAGFLPQHKDDDLTGASVKPEFKIKGDRRIDLVAECETFFIAFENKPWAGDQPRQVSDYLDHFKSALCCQKKATLFYLSRDGADPTETSISPDQLEAAKRNGELHVIAYVDLVPWLQECEKSALAPNVRHFIAEYISYIKYQFGGATTMAEQDAIIKACLDKDGHIEAAIKIGAALPHLKLKLLEKLRHQVRGLVDSSWEVESDFDELFKSGQRMWVRFPESENYVFSLAFAACELQKLEWGIQRKDKLWSVEVSKLSQNFHSVCAESGLQNGTDSWACFKSFEEPCRDWKSSPTPWARIQEGDELAKNIKEKFARLHGALKNAGVLTELK